MALVICRTLVGKPRHPSPYEGIGSLYVFWGVQLVACSTALVARVGSGRPVGGQ